MSWRTFGVMAAGLLGLVVAAYLGFLALHLISQPVGLSTIPPRAGDELVGPRSSATPGVSLPVENPTWGTVDDDRHSSADDELKSGDDHGSDGEGSRGEDHEDDHDD